MQQIKSSTVIETMLLTNTRQTTQTHNFKMGKEQTNGTNDSQYINEAKIFFI